MRAVLAWRSSSVVAAWAGVDGVVGAARPRCSRRWLARRRRERRLGPGALVALATRGAAPSSRTPPATCPPLVLAAVVPLLAVVTLVVVDWPSALVVLLTLPLLPVFAALVGMATRSRAERQWAALAALSGHFLDVVRGLPTLVAYGRAAAQVATVREVSDRHRRATMETLRIAFLSSAALELLATISVALVAVTVGLRLSTGRWPSAPALVAILLAPEAYWPVRRVGAEYHAAADGAVALDAILAQLEPAPSDSPARRRRAARGRVGEVRRAPSPTRMPGRRPRHP